MVSARAKGATVEDIAEALKLTPQAIYYRFRQEKMNLQTTPGEPNVPETALTPEAALARIDANLSNGSALLSEPTLPE